MWRSLWGCGGRGELFMYDVQYVRGSWNTCTRTLSCDEGQTFVTPLYICIYIYIYIYSPKGGATLRLGHQQLQHLRLLQVLRAGTDCYTWLTTIRVGATPAPWPPAASTPSPITAPLRGNWPLQHNWWPGTPQYCAWPLATPAFRPCQAFFTRLIAAL